MTTQPIQSTTDDLIAEIEQLSEKATQGKWWIDSHGHRMSTEDGLTTVFIASDKMGGATRHKETGNLSHWPNDWDASYIAACSPANVLALIARIRELEQAQRWIPCSERLPEVRERLDSPLTSSGGHVVLPLNISVPVICYDGNSVKSGPVNWFDGGAPINGVTHWMPLPGRPT